VSPSDGSILAGAIYMKSDNFIIKAIFLRRFPMVCP
jgi:hypothetical protein